MRKLGDLAADFTASNLTVCQGDEVTFTDNSVAAISWNWTFEGGSPATSTQQNPVVTYNSTGTFDVQLIVSDGTDFDTLLKEDYINVQTTPAQASTPEGLKLPARVLSLFTQQMQLALLIPMNGL